MKNEVKSLIAFELPTILWLNGCVYRLMPPMLRVQQQVRVLANSPEQFSVRVQASDHLVGTDGHVIFDSPSATDC